MSKNQMNYEDIKDRHLDEMIRLAFMQADALEAQATEDEPVDEQRVQAAYDAFLAKLSAQEARDRRRNRALWLRRGLPRVMQVAACVVLLLAIATPFALANVEAIRVRAMQLLIDIKPDHTDLTLVEDEAASFYVPAEWRGEYYPAYIPDGFVLEEISKLSDEATYVKGNDKFIYFSELTENDYVTVNSENADLSYEMVNGASAFVVDRGYRTIVTWVCGDKYLMVMAHTTKDEALAIARSVKKIS